MPFRIGQWASRTLFHTPMNPAKEVLAQRGLQVHAFLQPLVALDDSRLARYDQFLELLEAHFCNGRFPHGGMKEWYIDLLARRPLR